MATHLESLIYEYLDWQGYLVKRNIKVGRRTQGGWEMELDVIGYHPETGQLLHYEPSLDALDWETRERRFRKKFEAGRKYICRAVFPRLDDDTPITQIAVLITHPKRRHFIAGARIQSVDELMLEIRDRIKKEKPMASAAIPEQYPLLRTLQLSHVGYYRAL